MAASPECLPLLLGLGLRELSMSPRNIPLAKEVVRAVDVGAAEDLARRCVAASTAGEVRELLAEARASSPNREVAPEAAADRALCVQPGEDGG